MRGCVCPGGVPGDCLKFKDRPHFEVRVTMNRAGQMVRSVWVRIYTQEAAANNAAPGPGFTRSAATVQPGVIYVAPPDHHLLLEDDRVLVARGPKENRFRPSIDALFRSAGYTYGPRVIGVVLTGYLDDGTSGLWSVQRMDGWPSCRTRATPSSRRCPPTPSNTWCPTTSCRWPSSVACWCASPRSGPPPSRSWPWLKGWSKS